MRAMTKSCTASSAGGFSSSNREADADGSAITAFFALRSTRCVAALVFFYAFGQTPIVARKKSLRGQLYRAARDMGNVQAAEKGPGAYAKRFVRRKVYRRTNSFLGQLLRRIGG